MLESVKFLVMLKGLVISGVLRSPSLMLKQSLPILLLPNLLQSGASYTMSDR